MSKHNRMGEKPILTKRRSKSNPLWERRVRITVSAHLELAMNTFSRNPLHGRSGIVASAHHIKAIENAAVVSCGIGHPIRAKIVSQSAPSANSPVRNSLRRRPAVIHVTEVRHAEAIGNAVMASSRVDRSVQSEVVSPAVENHANNSSNSILGNCNVRIFMRAEAREPMFYPTGLSESKNVV